LARHCLTNLNVWQNPTKNKLYINYCLVDDDAYDENLVNP
jgi:hypothetical protein